MASFDEQIQFLESTGTQFIDTGICLHTTSDADYSIQMKANVLSNNEHFAVVVNSMYEVSLYPGEVIRVVGSTVRATATPATGSTWTAQGLNTIFEATYVRNETVTVHDVNTTIFAGYDSTKTTPWRFCKMRLYYMRIINHGVIVRDFIPVRVGQTGYLYDKVSDTLFGNDGTGSFVLGPDITDISQITLNGTTYNIKDRKARQSSGGGTAASTTYDNSDSGLQATNVQDAIDEFYAEKGNSNGIAELGSNGKVPASQLPSYVDDVINGYYNNGHFYSDDTYTTEISGATGYIYYDVDTTKQYRWNGSIFIEIINSGSCTATDVSYDNTTSGLISNNVQRAIDELNTKIYDAGNYETVSLTIGSADSTFSPVGQTITVTLEDGSSTDYVLTNSLVISFSVQKGVKYTISGTSTADYRILPVSYVATLQTRLITMRYIPIATGVFVLQSDGNYYLRQEYDAETMAEDAVGVLVLTSALINAGFGIVIGKNDNYVLKTRVYKQTVPSNTESGYNGKAYTEVLATVNDPAAIYCKEKILNIDESVLFGFLAAYNEAAIIHNNRSEINASMFTIGGVEVDYNGNWSTSSCRDYTNIGPRFRTAAGGYLLYGGSHNHSIRPCYTFPLS